MDERKQRPRDVERSQIHIDYERIWQIGLPIYIVDVCVLVLCGLIGWETLGLILFTASAVTCVICFIILIVVELYINKDGNNN